LDDPLEGRDRTDLHAGPGKLSPIGNRLIWIYTSEENWYCTRINLLLALDHLILPPTATNPASPPPSSLPYPTEYADYAKLLNECILYQTPKWRGKVYRGALHSPLEIFAYLFKRRFFIPSFTSTSVDPTGAFWKPWTEDSEEKGLQNVIFEIDLTGYNERTTIIQDIQTAFPTEKECLLGSYNLYEWKGYRFEEGRPIVMLEVLPMVEGKEGNVERRKGKLEIKGSHGDFPLAFLEKRGKNVVSREITPKFLHVQLGKLAQRYKHNHPGGLDWLNAPSLSG
jgi:hypothetical protein